MTALPHRLDRSVLIRARRETVFGFLTESDRWASWWGVGSSIDATPGGRVLIRHPNGVEASGSVVEVQPPERIVFTYGYASGKPSPPGSSRVTVHLDSHPDGTLLHLTHEFADAESRAEHVQGWRFQLSLFANLIADTATSEVTSIVDQWFTAWGEADTDIRERSLAAITSPDVRFGDRFSCLEGAGDLYGHLAAAQRFMPGMRLERRGAIRHCQWHVLADWVAVGDDGRERGRGTNLFELDADGRITTVTGFWAAVGA